MTKRRTPFQPRPARALLPVVEAMRQVAGARSPDTFDADIAARTVAADRRASTLQLLIHEGQALAQDGAPQQDIRDTYWLAEAMAGLMAAQLGHTLTITAVQLQGVSRTPRLPGYAPNRPTITLVQAVRSWAGGELGPDWRDASMVAGQVPVPHRLMELQHLAGEYLLLEVGQATDFDRRDILLTISALAAEMATDAAEPGTRRRRRA